LGRLFEWIFNQFLTDVKQNQNKNVREIITLDQENGTRGSNRNKKFRADGGFSLPNRSRIIKKIVGTSLNYGYNFVTKAVD
jgi:hypothetical protein